MTNQTTLPVLVSADCIGLRYNASKKYLQCVYRKKMGVSRIEATADTVVANARTRFSVEPSEEHDGGLVHVRCRYNNRYWVPAHEMSGSSHWIVGTADEPNEDLSSPSCTLFQLIVDEHKKNIIRFHHSVLKKYAKVWNVDGKDYLHLRDYEDMTSELSVSVVSRHEALPKYVAFKGDNDKYLGTNLVLSTVWERVGWVLDNTGHLADILDAKPAEDAIRKEFGHLRLQFHTKDRGDAGVIFETFTDDDGATVRLKSNLKGFWKRGSDHDDWVSTAFLDNPKDPDALFEVVTGDGFVALRNLGNRKFCKRLDTDGIKDCLAACDDSISQWARLIVEEPVVSREIYDIKFHIHEARIYNKEILKLVTEYSTNDTSKEMKATFSFVKKTEVVSKWETTTSSKEGVNTKLSLGVSQPVISAGGEVTFSSESASSEGKGGSESKTEETTVTREYTIPPRTTVAAQFVGMRACCDVPYSYKQREVMTTGEKVNSTHNDGIYTVANNYNFGIIFTDDEAKVKKLKVAYY